jgi:hypothetical protein
VTCGKIDRPNKIYDPFIEGFKCSYWEEWELIYVESISHSLTYIIEFALVFRAIEERGPPEPYT